MVQKYLDLSTAHVSKETADWLDLIGNKEGDSIPVIMYLKGSYGWIVYAAQEDFEFENKKVPADLLQVINYAKSLDCIWIMFDCDGEQVKELPVYEW